MLAVRNDANAVRASADGDYHVFSVDKLGRQLVTSAPRGQRVKNAITLTTTTETTLLSAGGASIFNDITKLLIANTSGTKIVSPLADTTYALACTDVSDSVRVYVAAGMFDHSGVTPASCKSRIALVMKNSGLRAV